MNDIDRPTGADGFEDRLLQRLLTDWPYPAAAEPARAPAPTEPARAPAPTGPARTPAPRRRLLVGAGAAATAVATAAVGVLVLNAGNPAYAIDAQPDGSFAVVLHSTGADDVAEVEKELKRRGARIELVPDSRCLSVISAAPLPSPPHAMPDGPPTEEDYPEFHAFRPVGGDGSARRNPITGDALGAGELAFIVRPDLIGHDQVLWVALARAGNGPATLVKVAGFAPVGAPQPELCQ